MSFVGPTQTDLNDYVQKLKLTEFKVKNNTSETSIISINYGDEYATITLKPGQKTLFDLKGKKFESVQIISDSKDYQCLNISKLAQRKITFNVETKERYPLSEPMEPFDFHPKHVLNRLNNSNYKQNSSNYPVLYRSDKNTIYPLTHAIRSIQYPMQSCYCGSSSAESDQSLEVINAQFVRERWVPGIDIFNGLLQDEGIDPEDYFKKLNTLYNKNRITSQTTNSIDNRATPRIPHITYHIWLTNPKDPSKIPSEFVDWAKTDWNKNPTWTHYFVVNDKSCQPELVEELKNTGMQVKEMHELFSEEQLQSEPELMRAKKHFDQAMEEFKFAKASDILRVMLSYEYGGYYKDTDTICYHNLDLDAKLFDSIFIIEPMSLSFGNAIWGTKPKHPVLKKYLEIINRNTEIPDSIRNAMLKATEYAKKDPEISPLLNTLESEIKNLEVQIKNAEEQHTMSMEEIISLSIDKSAMKKSMIFMMDNIYYKLRFDSYKNRVNELGQKRGLNVFSILNELEQKIYSNPQVQEELKKVYFCENKCEQLLKNIADEYREKFKNLTFDITGDSKENNSYTQWVLSQFALGIQNSYYQPRFDKYLERVVGAFGDDKNIQNQAKQYLIQLKKDIATHPEMKDFLREIEEGKIEIDRRPDYIRGDLDIIGTVVLTTGPHALTLAVYFGAGEEGNIDLPSPPYNYYPTLKQEYPYLFAVRSNDIPLPNARTSHGWLGSWHMNEKGLG